MKKINAQIIADSVNPQGNRIITFLLTYPRFIHGELMTHRMFSRNSASSRAIPFEKMVKMVEEDPFIPITWQRDHKGMQGTEYLNEEEVDKAKMQWIRASKNAINSARMLNNNYFGVKKNLVTKQLCNRLLEPFMWHTVLVTATEWDNFFELRCPRYNYLFDFYKSKKDVLKASKDGKYNYGRNFSDFTTEDWLGINSSQAEIHIQALAEAMWDAMNESIPNQLEAGEWHIPFGDNIEMLDKQRWDNSIGDLIEANIKVATARCARLSYMTFDGEINYEKDIKLHDQLLESKHFSPFEHCARAMNEEEYNSFIKGKVELRLDTSTGGWGGPPSTIYHPNKNIQGWCNNFRGFIPYRYIVENER